ncbi:MAG: ATP-binding protein [Phycisphaerales bacterium JB063]
MPNRRPVNIIAIDDDEMILRLLEKQLAEPHASLKVGQVLTFTDASEALAHMPGTGPIAILCDIDMPDGTGLDWLGDLIRMDVGPVLMLTASGTEQEAAEAFRGGASDYLVKGDVMRPDGQLHLAIADARRRYKLAQRNKEYAKALRETNHELQIKNQRLTEMTLTAHRFVDDVAHEFRTPLTVIREFASILQDGIGGEVTPEQRKFLDYIDASARDLGGMVDDFLDSSKLKAKQLPVHRASVTIESIFEAVQPTLATRAKSKSVGVEFEIEPGLPEVFVDAEKIGRVTINLVVNAIKFSPENSVVRVRAQADGNGHVVVSVRDQGVGIAAEQLPILCERFTQVGDPRRSVGKGFGLGLNIARDLVWLNLGEMQIESEQGEGSTFSFTVPMADTEHVLRQYVERMSRSDDDDGLSILKIHPINPSVTIEQTQEVLCNVARSMDILMPGEDGRCLYAVGPTEQPDQWIDKLEQAAAHAGERDGVANPLHIAWVGTWKQELFVENALPVILQTHREGRACA